MCSHMRVCVGNILFAIEEIFTPEVHKIVNKFVLHKMKYIFIVLLLANLFIILI